MMKSLPLKRGDQILVYSWTFYANVSTAHQVAESTGIIIKHTISTSLHLVIVVV